MGMVFFLIGVVVARYFLIAPAIHTKELKSPKLCLPIERMESTGIILSAIGAVRIFHFDTPG